MPVAGLGTYALSDEQCYASVTALLESGGRLIDTASYYGNEESVGRAMHGSVCTNSVIATIQSGYRLIDTASFYGNEREVGEGVRKSGVAREEILCRQSCIRTNIAMLSRKSMRR